MQIFRRWNCAIRIIPAHPLLPHDMDFNLVTCCNILSNFIIKVMELSEQEIIRRKLEDFINLG